MRKICKSALNIDLCLQNAPLKEVRGLLLHKTATLLHISYSFLPSSDVFVFFKVAFDPSLIARDYERFMVLRVNCDRYHYMSCMGSLTFSASLEF